MKKAILSIALVTGLLFSINEVQAQGRNEIGLSVGTMVNTAVNYRIGGEKFYGIAQVGFNYSEMDAAILGLGAGYSFHKEKLNINLEALFSGYLYDNFNEEMADKAFNLNLNFEWPLNDRFSFQAGPSIGLIENHSGMGFGSKGFIDPLTTMKIGGTEAGLFAGVNLGVTYKF